MMRYLGALVLGALGVVILVNLGLWQVRRLAWKEEILARIETRIAAPPVGIPAAPDPERDNYLAVAAPGSLGQPELHVLDSVKGVGPAWRIIAPFTTAGRRVMVDRGFVRDGQQDAPHPGAATEVVGNLNWPDDRSGATPPNDPGKNIWFARDIGEMAAALGTEPILVIARDDTGGGVTPLPVTVQGIPNDHLQYAITWFLLAAAWAGMTGLLVWRISRRMATDR